MCLLCILPFGMLFLSAISMLFVQIMLAVCTVYVGGYGGLTERGFCVFRELCPVICLEVGERPSGFLQSVVMSDVNCGDEG